MCGRFSATFTWNDVKTQWPVAGEVDPPWYPRYNVGPGQNILTIGQRRDGLWKASQLYWGIAIGRKLIINARRETIEEKPLYRQAYHGQRVIVPADGFYEWDQSTRQPYRFTLDRPVAMAAILLSSDWSASSACVVILTTEADNQIRLVHDRMPWVLSSEQVPLWLDRQSRAYLMLDVLCMPWRVYPVSRHINSVKNDSPDLILPAQGDT